MYNWNFNFILGYQIALYKGVLVTVELTILALLFATIIGLTCAICTISHRRFLRYPAVAFVEFFRATPALVILIWIYYALPILINVNLSSFVSGVLGLTLVQASYEAEIFRGGIESIEKGQIEAARSLGMSYSLTMRRIVLPQAIKVMIPPFVNGFAGLLKWSSLCSVIAVYELLNQGNNLIQVSFRPLEVYTVVAVLYFIMIFPVTQLSRFLEQKIRRH